jgi:DNA-directed RNA polymerase specialized sigma54-like protein
MRGPSQRLELRQSQRLIITPQMRQSIEMLQLPNLEVTDFIATEMEKNPFLEWQEQALKENTSDDKVGGGEGALPTGEIFTGACEPDPAEHGQSGWGEESDPAADFGGEPRPWHTQMGDSMQFQRPTSDSIKPQPGSALCASICSSKSVPT